MPAPISVQLYSLREEAKRDFPAVLERLARIGYAGVETAGLHGLAPADVRRRVADLGMAISSTHQPAPVGSDADRILDEQQALGCDTLVVPFAPPERFASEDAVRALAGELTEAHVNAKARGIRLGYHNHWWEFQTQLGGKSAHERLLELVPGDVFAEVDCYWARVGGADPAALVARLGARAPLLHVKDGPGEDFKAPHTAVGDGKLDYARILASGSARWHVVELDRCATDMFEAIERSHRYLVGRGLARGRA
jgi:sugar phosphate isomerase/epimerase